MMAARLPYIVFFAFVLSSQVAVSVVVVPLPAESDENQIAAGALNLFLFQNASNYGAVCNDGTPAGFYFRPGNLSKWSIHLEGGFWCWDQSTCLQRQKDAIDLTSSSRWQKTMGMGGLFSTSPSINPDFYDASSVFVPYCSSDSFNGDNAVAFGRAQWQFRGRRILGRLLDVLISQFKMSQATDILLSGCSAGGQAIVNNLDALANSLRRALSPNINVKGLADAGWMMNVQPRNNDVSVEQQFKEAITLWGGRPNTDCMAGNPGNEWMCYFSPYAQPYIKTPLLIQAQQYDQFQVSWDCCTPPFSSKDTPFVEVIRKAFATSMGDVIKPPSAAFSSACWQHCLSEDDTLYQKITIQGYSLQQYLGAWFFNRTPARNLIDRCSGFQCSSGCPKN